MSRSFPALIAVLVTLAGCRSSAPARLEIMVAAAANLSEVFQEVGPRFEAQTGIHPIFSFGSTAQLTQQIENSAPFDVFAAADAVHVNGLDRKGLLVPGTRAVYAIGVLALWVPPRSGAAIRGLEELTRPEVRVIAIAKPESAPYGQATVEVLKKIGLWDTVKSKVVYADNINMAKQYGSSSNADAVFTAYSLVLHERGGIIQVDEKLHSPIMQELGILASSHQQEPARKFVDFLLEGDGRGILGGFGYRLPERR